MPNDQTTPSSTDGLNPSQQNTPEFTLNLDTNDIAPSPVKTEPVIEPIIEKTPEPITEIKPESTPISTDGLNPSPEANPAPEIKSDFQKDQEIITQIQSTDGLNPSPIETLQAKSLQQSTPISTSINLDDIFGNTPAPQTAPQGIPQNIPMINPVTQQPITQQTVLPAFAPQGNIYQTAPQFSLGQATTFAKDNKKLIINIGIGIMIALVGIFVIKTMYPLGTKTNISSPQDILAANPSSTDDSWNISADSGHSAAPDQSGFDAFQDIPAILPTAVPTGAELNFPEEVTLTGDISISGNDTTLSGENTGTVAPISEDTLLLKAQINDYISQGKKALVLAKKIGDKDKIKNALFLYKKASSFLQDIENGTEMSTDKISLTLNQLSDYAQKIQGSSIPSSSTGDSSEFSDSAQTTTGNTTELPPLQ